MQIRTIQYWTCIVISVEICTTQTFTMHYASIWNFKKTALIQIRTMQGLTVEVSHLLDGMEMD